MYVLDASVFIQGFPVRGVTTTLVANEVRDFYLYEWLVSVEDPEERYVERVKRFIRNVGEKLSEADISVVALALQKGLPLLSDDFHVQNVGRLMGVEVKGVNWEIRREGIRRRICPVCGKMVRSVCPVCGVKGVIRLYGV